MAGTTGLEPAASAVTGQRSNQLNYVPNLFSYLYRKPACLVAFLRFNRFACIACFNPVEANSEVNRHQAKPPSKLLCRPTPTQAAVPAPSLNCSRADSDQYRFCPQSSAVEEHLHCGARRKLHRLAQRLLFREPGEMNNDQEQHPKGREKPSLPHAHLIGHEEPDENYHA